MTSERDKARRGWQFGLRELLLWTLIFGLIIGWWLDHRTLKAETVLLRIETRMSTDELASLRGILGAVQSELGRYKLDLVYGLIGQGWTYRIEKFPDGNDGTEER